MPNDAEEEDDDDDHHDVDDEPDHLPVFLNLSRN